MSKKNIHAQRHERLADDLRKELQVATPGTRMESMESIAARFDVSDNTARMALVVLQHEGWVNLRHGSGSYVSRPSFFNTGRSIAILSEYNLLLSPNGSTFYSHVMSELRHFFKAKGQTSHLFIGSVKAEEPVPTTLTCSEFLEDLALDRMIGVVALATIPLSWTDQAHTKGLPIVGMGGRNPRFSGVVDPDSGTAIRDAIHQFVSNGRTRPAFIGWDTQSCAKFNEVLTEVGLSPNPRWTRVGLAPLNTGAGWSDFREIWAGSAEKPDSLIFGDDVLFQDACPAIQACGVQIPAELEIVVLANKGIPLPQLFHYTRLDCDPRECAEVMGSMLLQLIAGETPAASQVTIPYRLVTDEDSVVSLGDSHEITQPQSLHR